MPEPASGPRCRRALPWLLALLVAAVAPAEAGRRTESLQDVPIGVTAFDGDVLEGQSLADLAQMLPQIGNGYATGTRFRSCVPKLDAYNQAVREGNQIHIRGVGQIARLNTLETAHSIDRVEALRGPQGALFGSSTALGTLLLDGRQQVETLQTQRAENDRSRTQAFGDFVKCEKHQLLQGADPTPLASAAGIALDVPPLAQLVVTDCASCLGLAIQHNDTAMQINDVIGVMAHESQLVERSSKPELEAKASYLAFGQRWNSLEVDLALGYQRFDECESRCKEDDQTDVHGLPQTSCTATLPAGSPANHAQALVDANQGLSYDWQGIRPDGTPIVEFSAFPNDSLGARRIFGKGFPSGFETPLGDSFGGAVRTPEIIGEAATSGALDLDFSRVTDQPKGLSVDFSLSELRDAAWYHTQTTPRTWLAVDGVDRRGQLPSSLLGRGLFGEHQIQSFRAPQLAELFGVLGEASGRSPDELVREGQKPVVPEFTRFDGFIGDPRKVDVTARYSFGGAEVAGSGKSPTSGTTSGARHSDGYSGSFGNTIGPVIGSVARSDDSQHFGAGLSYFVDGVEVGEHFNSPVLDTSRQLERLDVFGGNRAGAAMYGRDAIGGVINLFTNEPDLYSAGGSSYANGTQFVPDYGAPFGTRSFLPFKQGSGFGATPFDDKARSFAHVIGDAGDRTFRPIQDSIQDFITRGGSFDPDAAGRGNFDNLTRADLQTGGLFGTNSWRGESGALDDPEWKPQVDARWKIDTGAAFQISGTYAYQDAKSNVRALPPINATTSWNLQTFTGTYGRYDGSFSSLRLDDQDYSTFQLGGRYALGNFTQAWEFDLSPGAQGGMVRIDDPSEETIKALGMTKEDFPNYQGSPDSEPAARPDLSNDELFKIIKQLAGSEERMWGEAFDALTPEQDARLGDYPFLALKKILTKEQLWKIIDDLGGYTPPTTAAAPAAPTTQPRPSLSLGFTRDDLGLNGSYLNRIDFLRPDGGKTDFGMSVPTRIIIDTPRTWDALDEETQTDPFLLASFWDAPDDASPSEIYEYADFLRGQAELPASLQSPESRWMLGGGWGELLKDAAQDQFLMEALDAIGYDASPGEVRDFASYLLWFNPTDIQKRNAALRFLAGAPLVPGIGFGLFNLPPLEESRPYLYASKHVLSYEFPGGGLRGDLDLQGSRAQRGRWGDLQLEDVRVELGGGALRGSVGNLPAPGFDDSQKLDYFTPRFGGFQLGACYNPPGSTAVENTPTNNAADTLLSAAPVVAAAGTSAIAAPFAAGERFALPGTVVSVRRHDGRLSPENFVAGAQVAWRPYDAVPNYTTRTDADGRYHVPISSCPAPEREAACAAPIRGRIAETREQIEKLAVLAEPLPRADVLRADVVKQLRMGSFAQARDARIQAGEPPPPLDEQQQAFYDAGRKLRRSDVRASNAQLTARRVIDARMTQLRGQLEEQRRELLACPVVPGADACAVTVAFSTASHVTHYTAEVQTRGTGADGERLMQWLVDNARPLPASGPVYHAYDPNDVERAAP